MEKDLLVNKRYVNGLRLASITLFGLYLIGFINITFIPVIETLIVKQFASLVMVTGFITFGAIATLLKDENYNICLVFAVAMQIAFPLLFGSLINYEYSATSAYETFGGRLLLVLRARWLYPSYLPDSIYQSFLWSIILLWL